MSSWGLPLIFQSKKFRVVVLASGRIRFHVGVTSTPGPRFRPQQTIINMNFREGCDQPIADISTKKCAGYWQQLCHNDFPHTTMAIYLSKGMQRVLGKNAAHERNDWEIASGLNMEVKKNSTKRAAFYLRRLRNLNFSRNTRRPNMKSKKVMKLN